MIVPEKYCIRDSRSLKDFGDKTFSGYKKNDVLNTLNKSIISHKVEEACNWTTELVISGHINKIWDRILLIVSKYININNPSIPHYIYRRYSKFLQINKQPYYQSNYLELRNNQLIRNHICEVVVIITNSINGKSITLKKIPNNNFNINNIRNKFKAKDTKFIESILDVNDPVELKIILNEFTNSLNTNYDDSIYWLSWILAWEKLNIKKKGKYPCGYREITGIDNKYCKELVWLLWEIILKLCIRKDIDFLNTQVQSLYKLFKYNYSPSKKNQRICMIVHAIKLMTEYYNVGIPLDGKQYITLQACSKINFMYSFKKELEINDSSESQNKIDSINKLDTIFRTDSSSTIMPATDEPKTKKKLNKKIKLNQNSIDKFNLLEKIDSMMLQQQAKYSSKESIGGQLIKPKEITGEDFINDIENLLS